MKFHSCNYLNNCDCPTIQQSSETKYLGIIFDEKMTFKSHVQFINKKLKFTLSKFYYIKNIIPVNLKRMFYFAMVQSIFSYGILVWGGIYETNLYTLKILQKSFIRCVKGAGYRDHTENIFNSLNILNINKLYCYNICKFIKSNLQNNISVNMNHNSTKCFIPRVNLSSSQRMFLFLGPKIYNEVPSSIKIQTLKKFKITVKAFIIKNLNINILSRPFNVPTTNN